MASRPFCEAAMDREIREYLEDRLFPRVRGDGGWMEICPETEDGAVLTARGECAQCACAEKCAAWLSDMVEKPSREEAPSHLAVMGRYIIKAEIFELLEKTKPGKGGEIQLTDALRVLAQQDVVYAYDFEGLRYDLGDKLGFLKATVEFALRREEGTVRIAEEIQGDSGIGGERVGVRPYLADDFHGVRLGASSSWLPGSDHWRPGGLVCRDGAFP